MGILEKQMTSSWKLGMKSVVTRLFCLIVNEWKTIEEVKI